MGFCIGSKHRQHITSKSIYGPCMVSCCIIISYGPSHTRWLYTDSKPLNYFCMTLSSLSVCDHRRYAFIVAIFGMGGICCVFQPELSISAKTKSTAESHAYAHTMRMQKGHTYAPTCGLIKPGPHVGRENPRKILKCTYMKHTHAHTIFPSQTSTLVSLQENK